MDIVVTSSGAPDRYYITDRHGRSVYFANDVVPPLMILIGGLVIATVGTQ